MKLTLEQQRENLVGNYMVILEMCRDFESLNKYVPLQERACNIMQKACKSSHDLDKLNIFLEKYLVTKFNAME